MQTSLSRGTGAHKKMPRRIRPGLMYLQHLEFDYGRCHGPRKGLRESMHVVGRRYRWG